jgi:hypothetical protein
LAEEEVATPAAATWVVTAATITGFETPEGEFGDFFVVLPCPKAKPALIKAMNVGRQGWRKAGMGAERET